MRVTQRQKHNSIDSNRILLNDDDRQLHVPRGVLRRYPHVGECTLPLRVLAVARTMHYEALRGVTGRYWSVTGQYGTLWKRYGSAMGCCGGSVTEYTSVVGVFPSAEGGGAKSASCSCVSSTRLTGHGFAVLIAGLTAGGARLVAVGRLYVLTPPRHVTPTTRPLCIHHRSQTK